MLESITGVLESTTEVLETNTGVLSSTAGVLKVLEHTNKATSVPRSTEILEMLTVLLEY